mmetsp:Transcript_3209/g.7195  ORF Transcript_3209/g.7195 Transcript_3209/m.7195 type:complete len:207 (-) Transcript_3209:46-666(-)
MPDRKEPGSTSTNGKSGFFSTRKISWSNPRGRNSPTRPRTTDGRTNTRRGLTSLRDSQTTPTTWSRPSLNISELSWILPRRSSVTKKTSGTRIPSTSRRRVGCELFPKPRGFSSWIASEKSSGTNPSIPSILKTSTPGSSAGKKRRSFHGLVLTLPKVCLLTAARGPESEKTLSVHTEYSKWAGRRHRLPISKTTGTSWPTCSSSS